MKKNLNAVVSLTLVYLFGVADASYFSNILIDSEIVGELGYYLIPFLRMIHINWGEIGLLIICYFFMLCIQR